MSQPITHGQWAVTMFSFTNELLAAKKDSIELLCEVLDSGLTKVVELDGPQHFRNYPTPPTAEVAETIRAAADRGAIIGQLGIYIDRTIAPGRFLNHEQVIEQVATQLELAGTLGAKFARLGLGFASIDELRELVPIAESHDVTLVLEVQGTQTVDSPQVQENLAFMRELNSPNLGLLFDLSLCMSVLPPTYLVALAECGFTAAEVDELTHVWTNLTLDQLRGEIFGKWLPKSPSSLATMLLLSLVTRMGKSSVADWAEALPLVKGVHLKFWDADDESAAISGPMGELIEALEAYDFKGYFTSEWGGHEWLDSSAPSATMVAAHKKIFEQLVGAIN